MIAFSLVMSFLLGVYALISQINKERARAWEQARKEDEV